MASNSEILFNKLERLYRKTTGHGIELIKQYKEGHQIYQFGGVPKGIYYVTKGSVKITRIGSNGRELILRIAQSHDLIGYLSLLKEWSYRTTATCLEDSDIYFIAKPIFMKAIRTDSDFAYGVINLLCDRTLDTTQDVVDLASKSVKQRMSAALLTLDKLGMKKNGTDGLISLKKKDLGSMVGTIPETVSRQLAELEKDGAIKVADKSIQIINRDILTNISMLGD